MLISNENKTCNTYVEDQGRDFGLNSNKNLAKQFIDFGGWNLLEKTLERIKGSNF